jgi:virginiamycin B lyase
MLLVSSQLAPAQVFTEFPLPTSGSGPFGITTGPDGALWFTEGSASKIGASRPPV